MLTTALKGVMARKGRLALTFVSIVLGVSFVAGTFVFTDTIQARFDSLFTQVYSGVDATVRARAPEFGGGETVQPETMPASLVDTVRSAPEVASAEGYLRAFGQVIDASGHPVGGMGPPTYVYSWINDPGLNPFHISDDNGRAPTGEGEMVVDAATASLASLKVGDDVAVQFASGVQRFRLVGIASFGDSNNLAGATIAVIGLRDAQRILGLDGRVTYIDIAAREGVSQQALVADLAPMLPDGIEAVSGHQQTDEAISGFTAGLGFVSIALLSFAVIAVLVGAFVIYNTFRIIVAQRTRELALLRALGASGPQVVTMVLAEAFIVGVLASVVGVLAGVGVAQLIKAGMAAVGFGPPEGPLTLEPRTVVVAMVVGVLVTVGSSLVPALQAARVAPMAAMRDSVPQRPERRTRSWLRLGALAVGVVLAVGGLGTGTVGLSMIGVIIIILAVILLAPFIARPITMAIGQAFRGASGLLARANSARDPRRTAATATALTVGVALVVFTAIFASSMKESIATTVQNSSRGDLTVQSTNVYLPVSEQVLRAVREVPAIDVVSAVRTGPARVDGLATTVTAVDAGTIGRVSNIGEVDVAALRGGILIDAATLAERGSAAGDTLRVEFPSGRSAVLRIAGSLQDATLGSYVIDQATWSTLGGPDSAGSLLVALDPGVSPQDGKIAVEMALKGFPAVTVTTTSDQIANAVTQVNALLVLFTGLLSLALLIAILGIANTLALSIVERTREIGLLRAVGMSRAQVRWMITDEAVATALFGALLGSVLGAVTGWVIVRSMADQGFATFSLPIGQMAGWIVVAAIAGVVAAALPARQAARLDVLRAITYE